MTNPSISRSLSSPSNILSDGSGNCMAIEYGLLLTAFMTGFGLLLIRPTKPAIVGAFVGFLKKMTKIKKLINEHREIHNTKRAKAMHAQELGTL